MISHYRLYCMCGYVTEPLDPAHATPVPRYCGECKEPLTKTIGYYKEKNNELK